MLKYLQYIKKYSVSFLFYLLYYIETYTTKISIHTYVCLPSMLDTDFFTIQ